MAALARALIATARLRRRLRRARDTVWERRSELVGRLAPGASFADVGCMWGANGRVAFLAEERGADPVTAFDAAPPTPEFEAERTRRSSAVRYVRGDLHDPAAAEAIGRHDVVWCTGVIYHSPHPLLLLERLAAVCGEVLVLGSKTVPEVPGLRQATVFYPSLPATDRRAFAAMDAAEMTGLTTPFDRRPERSSANYWWGLTPSALRAMTESAGFRVTAELRHDAFLVDLIARPVA
jgi:hypothetical protein